MPPLCLVFDLDDTLFLEREYVRSGFEAVGLWARNALRVNNFAERAWSLFENGQRRHVFDNILLELGLRPLAPLVSQMVSVYRNHEPKIALLPDAAECLRAFRDRASLALISDGPATSQENKIRVLGIEGFFDTTILTDCWGKKYWKPHPRAFEQVQRELGSRDTKFVYVGDNPTKDFLAPTALGWECVRVRRPLGIYYSAESSSKSMPAFEREDLSDLPRILLGSCR